MGFFWQLVRDVDRHNLTKLFRTPKVLRRKPRHIDSVSDMAGRRRSVCLKLFLLVFLSAGQDKCASFSFFFFLCWQTWQGPTGWQFR